MTLPAVAVSAASVQDSQAGYPLFWALHVCHQQIRHVRADGGYSHALVERAATLAVTLQIVSKTTNQAGYHDSDMQAGPVDHFLDVAIERPALDQLEVEIGGAGEDRIQSGPAGDNRKQGHLHPVD